MISHLKNHQKRRNLRLLPKMEKSVPNPFGSTKRSYYTLYSYTIELDSVAQVPLVHHRED